MSTHPGFMLDFQTLWWMLRHAQTPADVATISRLGSGPLDTANFDVLMQHLNISVSTNPFASEILVIGREGWDVSILRTILDVRTGLRLRVYSQEMFLAYLVSAVDPLLSDRQSLFYLAGDHPALNCLLQLGFDWPSTFVSFRGQSAISELPAKGFLSYLGYRAGKGSKSVQARQYALWLAYSQPVPDLFESSGWGDPLSERRLEKLADCLAAFYRNARKKKVPPWIALEHWLADLGWLEATFYTGAYRFRWPNTTV